jgi:hypothetical protein
MDRLDKHRDPYRSVQITYPVEDVSSIVNSAKAPAQPSSAPSVLAPVPPKPTKAKPGAVNNSASKAKLVKVENGFSKGVKKIEDGSLKSSFSHLSEDLKPSGTVIPVS